MPAEIRTVPETGSTNDDLAGLARGDAAEGIWLRAERQTGGKGRQGRAWQSPPGNLYASTLVRLQPEDPPAPTLALVAAVALHETASAHASGIRIKWPNDLVALPPRDREEGRPKGGEGAPAKLAGILLEREGDVVIVGFGVNLADHPALHDRPATSIAALAGTAPDPAAFVEQLAEAFALWLHRWRRDGLEPIRRRWLEAAHPIGTALSTDDAKGLFDGLDESGALRLRLPDGKVRLIHAGDIFLI